VPKTVYRSSCRDKHNCQRRDSNLGPLTPQSDALTTRLLRPACCGQAFTVVLRHKSRHFRQSLVSIRRRVDWTLRRRVIVAHDVAAMVLRIRTIPVRSQSAIR